MPHNLDIALLRAFVTVAETGGMTRAATLLNLTQGAVSQQVKRLETLFGQALFDRDRAGIRLSPAGERLLPRATRMLEMNDALWAQMIAPEVEGELRFGVPHDIIKPYVPAILKGFAREWPRLHVQIISGTTPRLLDMLRDGALDMTLTTERRPGEAAEVLAMEPLVWGAAPGSAAVTRRPLPLALGDVTCAFRAAVLEAVSAAGMDWSAVCSESEMTTMTAIAAADLAVVPLLRSSIPEGLVMVGPEAGLPELPGFSIALYRALTTAPGAAALADHVRRVVAARAPV